MRKIFTLALSAFMLGGVSVSAQTEYTILEDLTASKIQNADFSEGTPVGVTINTYDYDMKNVTVGTSDPTKGLFGMQAVPGWTANIPSDNVRVMETSGSPARTDGANAKAAGIFAYNDDSAGDPTIGLGGTYWAPYGEGQGLGILAVWGSDAAYTQDVTLPAGAYMIVVKAQNVSGGEAFISSNNGFIANNGSKYLSTNLSFAAGSETWEEDVIAFLLDEETSGKISIGYKSGNYGSGGAAHLFIDNVKLYQIDPTPLIQERIDEAKVTLLEIIEEGDNIGVDTREAKKVYDNADATLEQVLKAIEDQKAINKAGKTDLSAFFLTNPHFTLDTPLPEDNGITTYDYDMPDPKGNNGRKVDFYGMQDVTGWVASNVPNPVPDPKDEAGKRDDAGNRRACGVFKLGSNSFLGGAAFLPPTTLSDGSTEGNVLGFVGVWSALSQYKQQKTLPAGQYTLEISFYNTGGTSAIKKNLMGFIEDNGTEHLATTTTFTVGKWLKEKIDFTLDEPTSGYFSMGYEAANVGSGGMPHFFIDGIALYYIGDTEMEPSLMGLQAAIELGEKYVDEEFYTGLQEQLEGAIQTGAELVSSQSSDVDANTAATKVITDLIPLVTANIDAYKALEDFVSEGGDLYNALEKYETGYDNLHDRLNLLNDDISDALTDYNWNTEDIYEIIASLNGIIKEELQKVFDNAVEAGEELDNAIDITPLFEQMSYTYSTSEQKGTNVPDKEWAYGDASNFKTQYGTAEVWNQSPFTVSRTLKNMPAGTYTLTTKAFYRTADNATNVDNYDPENELAFVFAGNNKTALVNSAELKSDESVGEGWAATADGSGIFVPNSQKAGYDIFNNEDYDAIVTKSVSTVLAETGDLTFGIKTDKMEENSWVLWYGFTIEYNAPDADVLNEDLKALIEEFHNYAEEQADNMNAYEQGFASDAEEEAKQALNTNLETMAAARKTLVAAFEEVKAGVAAWAAYATAADAFTAVKDEYYDDASLAAQEEYDRIEALVSDETASEYNTAELKAFISEMETAAAELKLPADYSSASDENGIEMTLLIQNPSFEDGLNGWTYFKGNDTQSADNSNATYHMELAVGNYVFNTWSDPIPADGLYVSQELKALPAGTYELQAVLASDKGNKIDLTANGVGMPFEIPEKEAGVELGEKNIGIEASIIFKLEEKGNVTIKASSKSWFKADNFRLTFYGTESAKEETEIEDIEIATAPTTGILYNLLGQPVNKSYKGIIIKDGKAYLNN